jgi:tellurite methyltransferase
MSIANPVVELRQRSVTKTLQQMIPFFVKNRIQTILDYGAGTLRNTCFLLKNGFKVYVAETNQQLPKFVNYQETPFVEGVFDVNDLTNQQLGVDLVISNFVLNIIDDPLEKNKLIENSFRNLKEGGYFLVEVKNKKCSSNCSQVVTCNRELSLEELDDLILPKGYVRLNSQINGISLAAIYQKQAA